MQNSVFYRPTSWRRSKLAIWHLGWHSTSQLYSSFYTFLNVNTCSSGLTSVRWQSQSKCHVSNINVDNSNKLFFNGFNDTPVQISPPLLNPPASLTFSLVEFLLLKGTSIQRHSRRSSIRLMFRANSVQSPLLQLSSKFVSNSPLLRFNFFWKI